jgi:hypothetical protein
MQRFIHNENLKRFHELLARESDPIKREQIERLIKEEEARESDLPEDRKSTH